MKNIVSIILTITIASLCFSSCKTNDTSWQRDCGAFVQVLTNLAPKAAGKEQGIGESNRYTKKFINKEVVWQLVFKEISKNKDGEDELQFDLEPFGLKQKFFSGKPVMMGGFKPAPGTLEVWKTKKPGSEVRISAKVNSLFFVTLTPGDNPAMHVPVAIVSIENVKLIQE